MTTANTATSWTPRAVLVLYPNLPMLVAIPRWLPIVGPEWVRKAGTVVARLKGQPDPAGKQALMAGIVEMAGRRPVGTGRDDAVNQLLALAFIGAGGPPRSRSGGGARGDSGDALSDYLDTLADQQGQLGQADTSQGMTRKEYIAAFAPLVDELLRSIDRLMHLR